MNSYAERDPDALLVGEKRIAAELFCTDEPSKKQIRQTRYWIQCGYIRTKRVGSRHTCTRRELREQVALEPDQAA